MSRFVEQTTPLMKSGALEKKENQIAINLIMFSRQRGT